MYFFTFRFFIVTPLNLPSRGEADFSLRVRFTFNSSFSVFNFQFILLKVTKVFDFLIFNLDSSFHSKCHSDRREESTFKIPFFSILNTLKVIDFLIQNPKSRIKNPKSSQTKPNPNRSNMSNISRNLSTSRICSFNLSKTAIKSVFYRKMNSLCG